MKIFAVVMLMALGLLPRANAQDNLTAHLQENGGVCIIAAETKSDTCSGPYYSLLVNALHIRSLDVSLQFNCGDVDPSKAKKAMANLIKLASVLKQDGVCLAVVNNIDNTEE
jgi:hypothetical protein